MVFNLNHKNHATEFQSKNNFYFEIREADFLLISDRYPGLHDPYLLPPFLVPSSPLSSAYGSSVAAHSI